MASFTGKRFTWWQCDDDPFVLATISSQQFHRQKKFFESGESVAHILFNQWFFVVESLVLASKNIYILKIHTWRYAVFAQTTFSLPSRFADVNNRKPGFDMSWPMAAWFVLEFQSQNHPNLSVPSLISWSMILKLVFSEMVGGLEHELYFPYMGNNHPNWRTPSFFRGVGLNHQPVIVIPVIPLLSHYYPY